MNKQQLAARIWESANNMRSKIEANEYKDYILGFIFYKFLSDREEEYLLQNDWTKEYMKQYLNEEDEQTVRDCQDKLGYFISYENLFSTWLNMGADFDVSNVRDALSAFDRSIHKKSKKVYEKIFETLQTGLSKLGDNSGAQTKAISKLISLIDPIPMDDKQDYDVLGFIYEFLISNFAANAGKKAGEFYTPHEVSQVMSQIVADHLKDRETIDIYDPTSGSGSLLITIGKSVAKHLGSKENIKYYAQELKENTYSLTRMNLVMRGIRPENIVARNGDTLADDWPYFDDENKEATYRTLWVDAVVSNPPYSQKWDPKEDPRFSEYGIAPKAKADYAFLLHDLYHLKNDGIMTIVLPHGVLFRGGEEGNIRKNLIENDNIDAIIGLPANIFFGTGIPTIIMVLKKHRNNNDVLIIDASKGFEKVGKNNVLRASDIKKIVDTYIERRTIDKYSKVVTKDEIRNNDYNLNIPRYVDSSEKPESFDIYASMFGGIPNKEIEEFNQFWSVFPSLKGELFEPINSNFSNLRVEDVKKTINCNNDVLTFVNNYKSRFDGFEEFLANELITNHESLVVAKEESIISDNIFTRLNESNLTDKYQAFQLLDNEWKVISSDLEIIKTEGFDSTKIVDPIYITKKKDGKDIEVQDGWQGRIIPFDLVQNTLLKNEADILREKENVLANIPSQYSELLEELSEDDKEELNACISEEGDSFINAEVAKYAKAAKKEHNNSSAALCAYKVIELIEQEKSLKKEIKELSSSLQRKTKSTIESLNDEQVKQLLKEKWITPVCSSIGRLPAILLNDFVAKIQKLSKKYNITYLNIDEDIRKTEISLSTMIDELDADEYDKKGLEELKKLLRGE